MNNYGACDICMNICIADMMMMIYGRYIPAFHYSWHSLFDKMDLDTCLTREAKNRTDLSCSPELSARHGSGPEIEGSGPNLTN